MKQEIKNRFLTLILITGLVLMAWVGVSSGEVRMAVVPFEVDYGQGKGITQCRVCGNIYLSGPVNGDPSDLLTRLLWGLITEEKGFDFINPDQVGGYYNVILAKKIEKDPLRLMKILGQEMKADYVLWGHIFRYQEREGSSFAAEKPASVAFDLHLLRVKDGKLVWKDYWDHAQKSLSENILELHRFVKSNMRWVTAEELSLQGLKKILKDFPTAESLAY